MQFIDYGGKVIALLLAQPNWQPDSVKLEVNIPWVEITEARAGDQDRQPHGESARYILEYEVDTDSARESEDLRMWLLRLRDETVAVPMWQDFVESTNAFNAGTTVIPLAYGPPINFGAEWIILNADNGTYEIVVATLNPAGTVLTLSTGCTLNWPAGAYIYPLLFGHIPNEDRPKFKADTDEILNGIIRVHESSPYARRLNPFNPGGTQICGTGLPAFILTPLFNIRPHHSRPIDSSRVDLLLTQIGFGREQSKYSGPYAAVRDMEHEFVLLNRAEIAALNWFYINRQGPALRFMMPTFLGNLRLTQDLPLGDPKLITIETSRYTDEDFSTNPGAPFLALWDDSHLTAVQVTLINEEGLHTIGDITQAYLKKETELSHLHLSRFAESTLTLAYRSPGVATTSLAFVEVPNEYSFPPVEKTPRAHLYRFTELVDVPYVLGRFTSYERPLVRAGDTWQPGPWSYSDLSAELELGDGLTLATFDFDEIAGVTARNPLRKMLEGTLEGRLWCDVLDVNPADPDDESARVVIGGYVGGLDTTGKEWTAAVDPFGHFLDLDVPGYYRQKVCNVPLFSKYCRLDRNDFRTDGTLNAWIDLTIVDVGGCPGIGDPGVKPANYFAEGGYAETGTEATFERRTILSSEPILGGQRINIPRPFLKAVDFQAVKLFPGCAGSIVRCNDTFDNRANHKGVPYAPFKNPSADIPAVEQSTGGKKG